MMTEAILFSEKQRFNQWWFWLIVLAVIGIPIFPILQNGLKHNYNWQQYLNSNNIMAVILPVLILFFLLMNRLETQITPAGIKVRYFPFHLRYKSFSKKSIGLAYVRTYESIAEYGGWGLRLGLFGRGKAYNIAGNKGIQLVFTDGSKLLIGTQKPDEADAVLQKAGYLKAELY